MLLLSFNWQELIVQCWNRSRDVCCGLQIYLQLWRSEVLVFIFCKQWRNAALKIYLSIPERCPCVGLKKVLFASLDSQDSHGEKSEDLNRNISNDSRKDLACSTYPPPTFKYLKCDCKNKKDRCETHRNKQEMQEKVDVLNKWLFKLTLEVVALFWSKLKFIYLKYWMNWHEISYKYYPGMNLHVFRAD